MTSRFGSHLVRALDRAARRLGDRDPHPTLALARALGIDGFVARQLEDGEGTGMADARLARRFHERLLRDAAIELSTGLNERGVPHFFAKGVALLETVYRGGDRDLVDVDVYVPPQSVAPAIETLRRCGYRELPSREQSGPPALRSGTMMARARARSDLEAVLIDLHWALDPVDRLLPRSTPVVPDRVWNGLDRSGPLPVPHPEHHAALIVHHVVHHDLLHVRGMLDLALLLERETPASGAEYEALAAELGVLRAARAIHAELTRELEIAGFPDVGAPPAGWRGRRLERLVTLDHWLAWAGAASTVEHAAITVRRVARRFILLDRSRDAGRLLADALWPPAAFLEWRWPSGRSRTARRLRHARQVVGKVLSRRAP